MQIKTRDDWIEAAKTLVPLMPEYLSSFSEAVVSEKVETELSGLVTEGNWHKLHQRFEEAWAWLPDSPSIHRHPFGLLCDLCSEFWVFDHE